MTNSSEKGRCKRKSSMDDSSIERQNGEPEGANPPLLPHYLMQVPERPEMNLR